MAQQLFKEESKPLHIQVSDFIREKIYSKEWGVHTKIPSEYSLVRELLLLNPVYIILQEVTFFHLLSH